MQDCHWIKKPSVRVMLGLLLCIFTIAANAAWANATEASQATVQPATRTVASFPTGTAAPARTIVPSDMAAPVETVAPIATIASDATGTIAGEEQIPLFDDTLLLTQPRNTANVGFWLIPNTVLGDDIALSLHLEASDTLIDARSTITLSLNGESLSTSRILDIVNNRQGSWETRIPKRLIRTDGRENVLTVLTMQRSIEGDSQDIDNPSNWVKLLSDSYFQLNIARQGTFQLSNVYDSFFHRMEEGDTLTVGFILDDTKRWLPLVQCCASAARQGRFTLKKALFNSKRPNLVPPTPHYKITFALAYSPYSAAGTNRTA